MWVVAHTVVVYASLYVKNVKNAKMEPRGSRTVEHRDEWLESQAIDIPEDIVNATMAIYLIVSCYHESCPPVS